MIEQTGLEIAIIGIAGRYPGATDIPAFWSNIKAGLESISFFSAEELLSEGISPSLITSPDYVRAGGIISDYDCFDAGLFGYTPAEAAMLDPQHRVFLECCWAALEDAGYRQESSSFSTGVFSATSLSTYLIRNILPSRNAAEALSEWQARLGNEKDHLSTRVAYKLNLTGPAITVQTACSSSLVAVHYACQSLLSGDCDLALAGGVSIKVPHRTGYRYLPGFTLSPDGHCRAFDAKAQGTVPGNGCGVLILKRLADAQADRDSIYCVIRGTAVNNDGASKVGYTAPSIAGQAAAITRAHRAAAVTPDTIRYVEAHGTGTQLGDPVEIAALAQAFGELPPKTCAIGSVKTNVGHTDVAAGVTGLIKAALAVRDGVVPPSLHYDTPNPEIPFDRTPFFVATSCGDWPASKLPRRAGVSSFGLGGTNAHVVLEEAGRLRSTEHRSHLELLILSGQDSHALEEQCERLAKYLVARSELALGDVAFTLQVGRLSMPERQILVCSSVAQAADALLQTRSQLVARGSVRGDTHSVAFVFPDASLHWAAKAAAIYDVQAVFRREFDACAAVLVALSLGDPRSILLQRQTNAADTMPTHDSAVMRDAACFALEYGLARMWMSWGVQPEAVFGVGVGEYVAACLAGVYDIADALKLVTMRASTLQADDTNYSDLGRDAAKLAAASLPRLPWLSGVTGDWMEHWQCADPEYWTRQLNEYQPERGLQLLACRQRTLVLPLGPRTDEWNRILDASGCCVVPKHVLPDGWADVLQTLGELWLAGLQPDWQAVHADRNVGRVPLPTYPFYRQRHWIAPPTDDAIREFLPGDQESIGNFEQTSAFSCDATSDSEHAVARVWADVLGLDRISVNDRFLELGGDSLLALKLVSTIQQIFDIRFTLKDLWDHSTVSETALIVQNRIIQQIQRDVGTSQEGPRSDSSADPEH